MYRRWVLHRASKFDRGEDSHCHHAVQVLLGNKWPSQQLLDIRKTHPLLVVTWKRLHGSCVKFCPCPYLNDKSFRSSYQGQCGNLHGLQDHLRNSRAPRSMTRAPSNVASSPVLSGALDRTLRKLTGVSMFTSRKGITSDFIPKSKPLTHRSDWIIRCIRREYSTITQIHESSKSVRR